MWNKDALSEIERKQKEWEDTTLKKSLEKSPETAYSEPTQIEKNRMYTPIEMAGLNYLRDLGFPGEFPFTRGIHPTMYRSRLWSMAQYSGFGLPEETNKRFKLLLSEGQEGVSLAYDLPTQLGFDSDNPLVESDVGVVGVACPSLREIETIFDGIPLDQITIRGSISHPQMILWAMYMAAAEKRGISSDKLGGTVSSYVLQEHIARGTYIFPPREALRLSIDLIEYCLKNIPKLNYLVSVYSHREAGCTLIQEGAFALAGAITLIQGVLERGIDIDDFAPRISFNFAIHMNLFEEVAKFRALRRLWARMMKDSFCAKKSTSLQFRFGPGTGGSTLTTQQAENNIVRVTIEALAAILGGCQYLHTASFDEGHSIPTERAVTIALRTQQILAYESGVTEIVDPLGGSYYVESLTNKIEEEVTDYLKRIEDQGGMIEAIETNWVQREITHSAYLRQREIEEGRRIIVGMNKFFSDEKPTFEVHRFNVEVAQEMKKRLKKLREERENDAVQRCLAKVRNALKSKENLMPFVLDAVKSYATVGEICDVFRDVFGEYHPPAL